MKVVFTAVNASYIHSNLAVRQLAAYAHKSIEEEVTVGHIDDIKEHEIIIREYTINESIDETVRDLYAIGADVYLFSTYIWNIRVIRELAEVLGKALPNALIGLGGPEVSFDPEEQLAKVKEVDFIIHDEGEEAIKALLSIRNTRLWKQQHVNSPADILPTVIHELPNVVCRHPAGGYLYGPNAMPVDMASLPFPYGEMYPSVDNRIVYYESIRGCPFNCSYCLSSAKDGVRAKPLEQVYRELDWFLNENIRQVKFVDRTFNYDRKRCHAIWTYLIDKANEILKQDEAVMQHEAQATVKRITGERLSALTNFHFEIAADVLNDELIDLLNTAPKGLFQLEIGVQSTDPDVLVAIDRRQDMDDLAKKVYRLRRVNNMHLHLDLIAGLPKDNMETFKKSFNDVIALEPHALQLGFLKLLKGTKLRRDAERGDALYNSQSPYEVISTKTMDFSELSLLKDIEWLVDRLYNTGDFENSMHLLVQLEDNAFQAFVDCASYMRKQQVFSRRISKNELIVRLYEYFTFKEAGSNQNLSDVVYEDYRLMPNSSEQDWQRILSRYSMAVEPDAKDEIVE